MIGTASLRLPKVARLLALLSVVLFLPLITEGQNTRPVRDDVGFCWDRSQMARLIGYLDSMETLPTGKDLVVAGISPHDDYLFAARVYYPLYRTLRPREAVIFGVTHGTVRRAIGDPRNKIILDDYDSWSGLSGTVAISPLREFLRARMDTSQLIVSGKAHALEHSIEALVPFLQFANSDIRITPIMVTPMETDAMERISAVVSTLIAEYMKDRRLVPGRDLVFLISSDANHYGADFNNVPWGDDAAAHRHGTAVDRGIGQELLAGKITREKIRALADTLQTLVWCGKYSVPFGLLAAANTMERYDGSSLSGVVLRYSDSYTEGVLPLRETGMGTTAPFSLKHWVGYLSAAYSPSTP